MRLARRRWAMPEGWPCRVAYLTTGLVGRGACIIRRIPASSENGRARARESRATARPRHELEMQAVTSRCFAPIKVVTAELAATARAILRPLDCSADVGQRKYRRCSPPPLLMKQLAAIMVAELLARDMMRAMTSRSARPAGGDRNVDAAKYVVITFLAGRR